MQHLNKIIITSILALMLVCGLSLSGVAAAQPSSVPNDSPSATSPEAENQAHLLTQQYKHQAQQKVQDKIKTEVKQHTAQQRQQACEARKTALTDRMNNAVKAAQRHKEVFDGIYTKVKNFYTSKNLTVSNYSSLTTAVDSAQSDTAAKIAALQSLDISVDCTQADSLASNISAFQTAEGATRDSLKSYRKALVDLITVLHGASTAAKTGSTDNSSTNTSTAN